MAELRDTLGIQSDLKASILLVDDNPANLLSLRSLLEVLGQNLVEVRSGEEAIQRVQSDDFAVVLLDVMMPGIGGLDTAQAIRQYKRSRHTPIIFVTASDIERQDLEQGYALGAVDFLVKPLLPAAVQAKVHGFVELFNDKQRAKQEADQFRFLVQGTTEYAIFMLDPQGRVVTWNSGAERFKGYKADEIIGQHVSKFYPQEAIDRGWPAHELKVATAEGRFEDDGWRVRKDGAQFWANVVITALRDEQGQLRGFSRVTRDLTARKQAEEVLRRSEERFRLLYESVQDYAIFLLDPQGHVASWNTGAKRIKQYKADEIIGEHFSKFYPQEAIDRGWPAHELKVATAEGRFEDEGWRVRKDGTQFWANIVITALRDEDGNFVGFSKITRDLTERKQSEKNTRRLAEEAAARRVAEKNAWIIQEQRERLHVTLASIGDAVITTDAEGRVTFLNPVAQELIGWKTEEVVSQPVSDVFHIVHEDTRQPVENPAIRALKDGVIVGLANHTVLIAKDGKERPIDDSAAPIRDAGGNVVGSVLVFRDTTARRRAEGQIRDSLEEKEILLKEIHHRVKNNLQVISSLLDLQSQHTQDAGSVEMFRESMNRVRSMALIHERLYRTHDLARVDFAAYLDNLADDLLQTYRVDAEAVRFDLQTTGDVRLPIDTAVPCGLLVNELISNCLKHAFRGRGTGVVHIDMRPLDGGTVRLTVADDGVGLPDGIDSEHAETFGLQLVGMLADQLRGKLEIDRGNGTTFRITFPLSKADPSGG